MGKAGDWKESNGKFQNYLIIKYAIKCYVEIFLVYFVVLQNQKLEKYQKGKNYL